VEEAAGGAVAAAAQAEREKPRVRVSRAPAEPSAGELDVRGKRVAEMEELVSEFVDRCTADGMATCRIIHGTGTGALRQAVRDVLSHSPLVASFTPATREAGGNGVTVVEIA
jgi:DNA mismatch repair protein MutS2